VAGTSSAPADLQVVTYLAGGLAFPLDEFS